MPPFSCAAKGDCQGEEWQKIRHAYHLHKTEPLIVERVQERNAIRLIIHHLCLIIPAQLEHVPQALAASTCADELPHIEQAGADDVKTGCSLAVCFHSCSDDLVVSV
jgi:hypothetical protein